MQQFKNNAEYYYQIARGIDTREVKPNRKRRSFGTETTFSEDISDEREIKIRLLALVEKLGRLLEAKSTLAYTLTLKFKFSNFKQITRSITLREPIDFQSGTLIDGLVHSLLDQAELNGRPVRLLGANCSNLFQLNEADSKLIVEQLRLID
jgi:DNA polymerase-4